MAKAAKDFDDFSWLNRPGGPAVPTATDYLTGQEPQAVSTWPAITPQAVKVPKETPEPQEPPPTPRPPVTPEAPPPSQTAANLYRGWFRLWYGVEPTAEQLASYVQQGQSWSGAETQVLQNLYRMSPAYSGQVPKWQDWRQPPTPPPPPLPPPLPPKPVPPLPPKPVPPVVSEPILPLTREAILGWLRQYGSLTGGLRPLADQLSKVFPGLKVLSDDKIQLPNGQIWDVIGNYGGENPGWVWYGETGGPPAATTGYNAPGFTGTAGPSTGIPGFNIDPYLNNPLFDDPATQMMEDAIRKRLEELIGPIDDKARQQLSDLLQGRTEKLQTTPENPELAELLAQANARITELQQPPYTAGEEAALRTQAFDQLERERQGAIQREVQRMLSLGHAPTSGTIQDATERINRQYDEIRAGRENALAVAAIDRRQQRLDEALGIQTQLYGVGVGEQERTEARSREAIDAASILAELTQGTREEEQSRRREALALAALLPDMERQRMLDALAILQGTTPNSQGLFSQILGLQVYQGGQENIRSQQRADFWAGLGDWIGILINTQMQTAAEAA